MSRTILLADDSVTIQKVVELTFLDREHDVHSVTNGDEALAWLGEQKPDLVIADVHMPGANGYEVCKRAKELHPGLPVLLLVGTFEPFEEEDARSCGSDGYLKKPFDSQELLRRVEELLSDEASPRSTATEVSTSPPSPPAPPPQPQTPVPAEVEMVPSPAETRESEARTAEGTVSNNLSDEQVEQIARRVVELIGEKVVREVAWEVIPDLAEVVIKDRLRELEEQVERL